MYVFLNSTVNKKQLKVKLTFDGLYVNVNGETIIDGKWKDKINTDDSFWTI